MHEAEGDVFTPAAWMLKPAKQIPIYETLLKGLVSSLPSSFSSYQCERYLVGRRILALQMNLSRPHMSHVLPDS